MDPLPPADPDRLQELVDCASHGDVPAIDELLHRYLPGLRGYVRLNAGRMLLARESGTDLVQSVCREVLEHVDRFQYGGEAGFKHWLYTTAQRKIARRYEYYRAQKRDVGRERPPQEDEQAAELIDCYRSFCTPSQVAIAGEELRRIERAFSKLTDEQREVILMARIVGLSRREIGERMGRSEGAVRTMLSRALATLAEHLDE